MKTPGRYYTALKEKGFAIIDGLYSNRETVAMIGVTDRADRDKDTFRGSADLFAIRQLFKEIPKLMPLIFNASLRQLIHDFFGLDYFIMKSIYFDKPEKSNCYVAYHQDLAIAVAENVTGGAFRPLDRKTKTVCRSASGSTIGAQFHRQDSPG